MVFNLKVRCGNTKELRAAILQLFDRKLESNACGTLLDNACFYDYDFTIGNEVYNIGEIVIDDSVISKMEGE